MLDLRLPIAAAGVCIALLALQALVSSSEYRTLIGDIVCSITLVVGVLTTFTAPVISGLIRYQTSGTFEFTWWW